MIRLASQQMTQETCKSSYGEDRIVQITSGRRSSRRRSDVESSFLVSNPCFFKNDGE